MKLRLSNLFRCSSGLAIMVLLAGPAFSREKPIRLQFKYVGGTESVGEGREGKLELSATALTFRFEHGFVSVPYTSIRLMQYRPDVSRQVRKMKLPWKIKPPYGGGKKNRYFTVLYEEEGTPQAIVLEALPEAMRPYFAEIDLKAGKRVEVKGFEEYD